MCIPRLRLLYETIGLLPNTPSRSDSHSYSVIIPSKSTACPTNLMGSWKRSNSSSFHLTAFTTPYFSPVLSTSVIEASGRVLTFNTSVVSGEVREPKASTSKLIKCCPISKLSLTKLHGDVEQVCRVVPPERLVCHVALVIEESGMPSYSPCPSNETGVSTTVGFGKILSIYASGGSRLVSEVTKKS